VRPQHNRPEARSIRLHVDPGSLLMFAETLISKSREKPAKIMHGNGCRIRQASEYPG